MTSNAEFYRKNFFKFIVATVILLAFVFILTPFCLPIILGGILAMAFSPFLGFFIKKGWSRKWALIVLTISLFVLGLAPVSMVFIRGTKMVTHFLQEQSLVETKSNFEARVNDILYKFSEKTDLDPDFLQERFNGFLNSAGSGALNFFSNILAKIPNIALLSFITVLSFYFSLRDEIKIRRWFDHYFYFSKENGDRFIEVLKSSCKEVFFSNVITGTIQASIVAIGAWLTKTGDPFIIFVITFFLSFIPVIGAGPVGFILAATAFVDGRTGPGFVMTGVAAFTGVIDNIIRPYFSSRGDVSVPTFITFLSIIGGVVVMGIAGLFVGPLLASLTYGALPIILEEWFPRTRYDEPTQQ